MEFRFENSGTSRTARELSRMAGYATAVVVVAGAGIHVLLHVQLSSSVLVGHHFCLHHLDDDAKYHEYFPGVLRKPETGCHRQDATNHRYRHLLCRSHGYPDLVKQEIREQRGSYLPRYVLVSRYCCPLPVQQDQQGKH